MLGFSVGARVLGALVRGGLVCGSVGRVGIGLTVVVHRGSFGFEEHENLWKFNVFQKIQNDFFNHYLVVSNVVGLLVGLLVVGSG